MAELAVIQSTEISPTAAITEGLYIRWIEYIDAAPKTVETYTKSIKQFFNYLAAADIRHPERQDILAYRDYLKAKYKPTTVQSYLAAVKLFFQWLP